MQIYAQSTIKHERENNKQWKHLSVLYILVQCEEMYRTECEDMPSVFDGHIRSAALSIAIYTATVAKCRGITAFGLVSYTSIPCAS